MIPGLIGKKVQMSHVFVASGKRVPVTVVRIEPAVVSQNKTMTTDGYSAVQVAFGSRKRSTKPVLGHIKKASLTEPVAGLREFRLKDDSDVTMGAQIKIEDVLQAGDLVTIQGVTKGKGFAGGVKRWGFSGGPKTHGQSDRHRAPGSIGSGTTPGRVLKGKKMSGRMGNATVSVPNLMVLSVDAGTNTVLVSGSLPGSKGGVVILTKTGSVKNFDPIPTPSVKVDEVEVEVKD